MARVSLAFNEVTKPADEPSDPANHPQPLAQPPGRNEQLMRMLTRREALKAFTAATWYRAPRTPGTRAGHALTYHAGLNATCLIGGDAPNGPDNSLWLWDGMAWAQRPLEGPGVTSLVVAVSDPDERSILTYGGFGVVGKEKYGPPTGELWELMRNARWRRHVADGPGPRHHHAAAFDSTRGRLVLYGGIDRTGKWSTDVWEWDRRRWYQIQSTNSPGERAHHATAFDSRRGRVVLFGGVRSNKDRPTDTWEWDGKMWYQAATEPPDPGGGCRMAFDVERGLTVLFGGNTCLWDGKNWTRVTPANAPSRRTVHALAQDPLRKRLVLYGGTVDQRNVGDTWEWDGSRWTEMGS